MNRSPDLDASATDHPWLLGLRSPEPAGNSPSGPVEDDGRPSALPEDTLGLALSGGGIRSATFCLGVLQALARAGWLRHVDYLSTVSGGGYIGSFLGRYFDSYRGRRGEPELGPGAVQDRVARGLDDPDSEPIDWLRRHSNYLAPGGLSDASVSVAGGLRNLLTVYVVLGVALLALFGVLNAVGYSGAITKLAVHIDDLIGGLTPLTRRLPSDWTGPWMALAELALWLAVVPLMIAYWLVSQDLSESFVAAVLVAAAIIAAALTLLTGGPLPLVILTAAVLWSVAAWAVVRWAEGPADPLDPYRLSLARDHLTRRLASWLRATLALAALAAIDGVGRWLALRMVEGGLTVRHVAAWLVSVGTTVLASTTFLRMVVLGFATRSAKSTTIERAGRRVLLAALILLLGAVAPLVAFSFVSHASYGAGRNYSIGLAVTAVALVVSLLFGSRECVPFINRSGKLGLYSGRLSRTFLGAVNPARRLHPEGQDVTRSVAGDDVPLARYRPDRAGGPLHLINCAVNETFDVASFRAIRDRQAENLAVGPAGLSVARDWHAFWADGEAGLVGLEPLGVDAPDPFLGRDGERALAESLSLQEWMAISGAAVGPGMGRFTRRSSSLLYTLANARLGYWWNSGLDARDRVDSPIKRGTLARLATRLGKPFRAQGLLLSELTGRFGGPWLRYWHLSDGGFFEVTGAYELLRRRLPFVILCDATEDPEHRGTDLALLVRLARIDLGAEFTAVSPDPDVLNGLGVPPEAAEFLGSLDDVHTPAGALSRKHATLFRVRYPEAPPNSSADPWLERRLTWLLYIKASCNGDEPADVTSYAADHPDFPHEPTLDQKFDEPQWESYRKLGQHIGESLFVPTRAAPPPTFEVSVAPSPVVAGP